VPPRSVGNAALSPAEGARASAEDAEFKRLPVARLGPTEAEAVSPSAAKAKANVPTPCDGFAWNPRAAEFVPATPSLRGCVSLDQRSFVLELVDSDLDDGNGLQGVPTTPEPRPVAGRSPSPPRVRRVSTQRTGAGLAGQMAPKAKVQQAQPVPPPTAVSDVSVPACPLHVADVDIDCDGTCGSTSDGPWGADAAACPPPFRFPPNSSREPRWGEEGFDDWYTLAELEALHPPRLRRRARRR